MQKWEYRVLDWEEIASAARREELFNKLGLEGWELVMVTDDYAYIFKRPKADQPQKLPPIKLPPVRQK